MNANKEEDIKSTPEHIAIIMDGNGRWAAKRGLPRNLGHREGAETLRKIVKESGSLGVRFLTVYAFSTENWSRPAEEVGALTGLISEYVKKYLNTFVKNNIKVKVIGDLSKMDPKTFGYVSDLIAKTENNTGLTFTIAWNYGGRSEIVNATKRIAADVLAGKIDPEAIDDKLFSDYLYTAGLPDPDLIIRTSGELRTSNFLIWQGAYSEYYVTDVLWPDFDRKELLAAIGSYGNRKRRFGGL
jgi:undecaprenyl diphosphate synthase